jgi:hypothetical protein
MYLSGFNDQAQITVIKQAYVFINHDRCILFNELSQANINITKVEK